MRKRNVWIPVSVVSAVAVVGILLATLSKSTPVAANAEGVATLMLYQHVSYNGLTLVLTESASRLPRIPEHTGIDEVIQLRDWNDQASSLVVVKGTWRIYQHADYNTSKDGNAADGWSCLVSGSDDAPEGIRYPCTASLGLGNDDISSIELVSPDNLPAWAVCQPRRVSAKAIEHDPSNVDAGE